MAPLSFAGRCARGGLLRHRSGRRSAGVGRPNGSAWSCPPIGPCKRVRETPGTTLTPFTTDGCSGGLSDAWRVVADRFPAFAEAHREAPPVGSLLRHP